MNCALLFKGNDFAQTDAHPAVWRSIDKGALVAQFRSGRVEPVAVGLALCGTRWVATIRRADLTEEEIMMTARNDLPFGGLSKPLASSSSMPTEAVPA